MELSVQCFCTAIGDERQALNQKIIQASATARRNIISQHGQTEEQKREQQQLKYRDCGGVSGPEMLWLRLASILRSPLHQQKCGNLVGPKPPPVTPSPSSHHPLDVKLSGSRIAQPESFNSIPAKSARKRLLHLRYQSYLEKAAKHGSSEVISYEEFCAHYIQNWWSKIRRKERGSHDSVKLATTSAVQSVSVVISPSAAASPSSKPNRQPKTKVREGPLQQVEAATLIQRSWRRHIDIQVYRYYRDLINFRCCGNPALMLRCINPRESKLLDPAAGIHIKFRLAGTKFPPNIYYKIFTHRNIVDMCANSPKDYTDARAKRKAARDVHNRRGEKEKEKKDEARTGWYQRIENNGWRLVSDRLILKADQDPVTWESSKKTQEFHHSKLKRKVDVERKKRRRKLEWMQKMYQEGKTESNTRGRHTGLLVEGAASGMLAVMDEIGPDAVEDWEVDELLEWTNGLNFDDYLTDWQAIATSASSEKLAGDNLKFDTTQPDPFEFTLSIDTPTLMAESPSHPGSGKRAPMPTP
ncbi:hypothetical protein BSL78_28553 [Apostichopus japonicus]|uniref:Uncharacterized protein n=1 Tax=Stichopus japonicus TaxID=307972 RepID=A0A2G8JFW4_STIJA|nr:hypothetical protein BSL78_28553 [Apostichopus japonicus]